jgi:uncharacterized repeat protein (TIGR03899 family)
MVTKKNTDMTSSVPIDDTTIGHQSTASNNANITSQRQLLSLARQFAIDGTLITKEQLLPIDERALKRVSLLNIRQQQNLEHIIHKAIAYSAKDKVTDRMDIDWFYQFTQLAETVSNPAMQDLWAKILASEAEKPSSFSLKALQAFKLLSISEAKLFAKACGLAVKLSQHNNFRIITGCYQAPSLFNFFNKTPQHINLNEFGLSYSNILTLANNHLLFKQEAELELHKNEILTFDYQGELFTIGYKKQHSVVTFLKFTALGNELAQLIAEQQNPQFFNLMKEQLALHVHVAR